MVVETQNNQLELSNLSQVKDQMLEKDFQTVIEAFEKMPPDWKRQFLEWMASKDTHFNNLYTQLKKYFWNEIVKLQKGKSTENKDIKNSNDFSLSSFLWKEKSIIENNEYLKEFKDYFEQKELNWRKVSVLKENVYQWYLRYSKLNPETQKKEIRNTLPLAKALWEKELLKAKEELQSSLKASSNMLYAPQNMDSAKLFAEQQYDKKEEDIIKKYTPLAEKLVQHLENTDFWNQIIWNTVSYTQEERMKKSVNNTLWFDENSETEIGNKIKAKTQWLTLEINQLKEELSIKIKDFQWSQENLKQRDYITRERILYQDIPEQSNNEIANKIKNYAFEVGKDILNNPDLLSVVKDKKRVTLPIWNGDDVVLDFSQLWNIDTTKLSKKELLDLYTKNFDTIYRNSFSQKVRDYFWDVYESAKNNPGKTTIDVSSVIIAWLSATVLSYGTFWYGIPVSWAVATVVDNAYRWAMYQLFLEGWYKKWMWIEEDDTTQDIFIKKSFELWANTVLFWMFKATKVWEAKTLEKFFTPNQAHFLENSYISTGVKTGVEAWFFTAFSHANDKALQTVLNDGNIQEIYENIKDIPNMDALLKAYTYNLLFITLVKTWAKKWENIVINQLEKKLSKQKANLESQWYQIVDSGDGLVLYKWLQRQKDIKNPDIKEFIALNKKIMYLNKEPEYRKAENGRWWKSWYTITPREEKFQKLEEFSKETQVGKISYALWDKSIWETLQKNWLQNWKWVWEWLLKKSWFSKEEISEFKKWKLSWEKPNEVKAIKEMDKAMEVVYREYKEWLSKFISWKSLRDSYPNVSKELLPKLWTIITKELELTLPIYNK